MNARQGGHTCPPGYKLLSPTNYGDHDSRPVPLGRVARTRYRQVMPATVTAARSESLGRIPIRALSPQQPENRWPATGYVGEVIPFEATVFREGHGLLRVELVLTHPDEGITLHPMELIAAGTDRWRAEVQLTEQG